jgi:hypothetical protein
MSQGTLFLFNPAADREFARIALAAALGAGTPDNLEALLRGAYPRVRVHVSEVSGSPGRWYVYREGHWVGSHAAV